MTVTEVLESQQGEFLWGTRDCCTTTVALCEELLGRELLELRWSMVDFHDHATEAKAIRKAEVIYGSVGLAYTAFLGQVEGVEEKMARRRVVPGDIVWLEGDVFLSAGAVPVANDHSTIGFNGDDGQLWVWTARGLRVAWSLTTPVRVFRCHR